MQKTCLKVKQIVFMIVLSLLKNNNTFISLSFISNSVAQVLLASYRLINESSSSFM